MDEGEDPDRGGRPSNAPRKPYKAPRLERLGTLTEITADVGTRGSKSDMGPNPMKKTS
jgi:hypothetical protein